MADDEAKYLDTLSDARKAEVDRARFPLHVVVNPVLTPVGDETDEFFEGCLSVAGFSALIERRPRVRLTGVDADGAPVDLALHGWPARIAQHECDHLDGTLYIDHMDSRGRGPARNTFTTTAAHDRWWKTRPAAEVRRLSSRDPS